MNQDYVVRAYVTWNLEQAQEQLDKIVYSLRPDEEINEQELKSRLSDLYWNLNVAWNSRNASADETAAPSDEQFNKWTAFPEDIYDNDGTVAA